PKSRPLAPWFSVVMTTRSRPWPSAQMLTGWRPAATSIRRRDGRCGGKGPAASPVVLRGHEGEVSAVAISADAHWLVTAGNTDRTARLWDLQAKDPAASPMVLRGHENGVTAVAISPDAHWLVTASLEVT